MMFRSAPRGMPAAASPRLPSSLSRHASAAACRALLLVLLVTAAPGTTRAGVARPTPMAGEGGVAAVTSLDALPDGTLLLTAGSHFEQGLFASDDAGESWQQRVASGVFPRRWYTEGYRYLTTTDGRLLAGPGVHPLTDEVVRFLFESRDGGRTWRDFDPGAEPIGVDPADPDLWLALSRYEDTTGYNGMHSPGASGAAQRGCGAALAIARLRAGRGGGRDAGLRCVGHPAGLLRGDRVVPEPRWRCDAAAGLLAGLRGGGSSRGPKRDDLRQLL